MSYISTISNNSNDIFKVAEKPVQCQESINPLDLLRQITYQNAQFRPGQSDAISSLINREKLLLIQPPDWGKSTIYQIVTQLNKSQNKGLTIVISPLLPLMRHHIKMAEKLGLRSEVLHSAVSYQDCKRIHASILNNNIDLVLIKQKYFVKKYFIDTVLNRLSPDTVGLIVIDEAHCMSEYCHSPQAEYRTIFELINKIPNSIPVLATTATANFQVIRDIQHMINGSHLIKGDLAIDNISLNCNRFPGQVEKLVWLADKIPNMSGSGIIFATTVSQVEFVARWLQCNNIDAKAYHSSIGDENYRTTLENDFMDNRIKILVSTTALGTGFRKPDLSFVVHYQVPKSLSSYYQQVGRIGRDMENTQAFLMFDHEDLAFNQYLVRSNIVEIEDIKSIISALKRYCSYSVQQLEASVNLSQGVIRKILENLSIASPGSLYKEGSKWICNDTPFNLGIGKYVQGTNQNLNDLDFVENYLSNDRHCRSSFLMHMLGEHSRPACGKCDICNPEDTQSNVLSQSQYSKAISFMFNNQNGEIKSKTMVPVNALSCYGISSFRGCQHRTGNFIFQMQRAELEDVIGCRKPKPEFFDLLVDYLASVNAVEFDVLAYIPSEQFGDIIHSIAMAVADKLKIRLEILFSKKTGDDKISDYNNSTRKCQYIADHYELIKKPGRGDSVLLFDLLCDSGWTVAVMSALLIKGGAGDVFPLVLASSCSKS